ncbi:hypothetical protein [Streptomyces sp. NPDC001537]
MHPRRFRRLPRTAAPAAVALLCAVLASCSSGSPSPAAVGASPIGAAATAAVSPGPAGAPSVFSSPKTLPPSHLCNVLDESAARKVVTAPKQAPRLAPGKGTAGDSCSYASGDGTALLTLNPSARSYDAEVSASRSLVRDPASAGMSDVQVTAVTGLGQSAFRETVVVLQPRQNVAYVVWRAGSRTWVLSLAETGGAKAADRLVPLARQLTPRLPH